MVEDENDQNVVAAINQPSFDAEFEEFIRFYGNVLRLMNKTSSPLRFGTSLAVHPFSILEKILDIK